MINMIQLTIHDNEAHQRLDRFLRKRLKKAPLSVVYKIIRRDVKVNGRRAGAETMLCPGDEVTLYLTEERFRDLSGPVKKVHARKQFQVAYEDDNILVVNKPQGLITHGDAREKRNTLVNQVNGYLQEKGEYDPARERTFTPSPVNRLDRNTTGLVLFGKNAESLRILTRLLRQRSGLEKYYMTVVAGNFRKDMVLRDRLSKDHRTNVVRIAKGGEGQDAVTCVRAVAPGETFSLVEVRLITGRTHQIRTHLAHAGFPLAGDPKYGNRHANAQMRKFGIHTQMLHAYKLKFGEVPGTLAYLSGKEIQIPLPDEFLKLEKITGPR